MLDLIICFAFFASAAAYAQAPDVQIQKDTLVVGSEQDYPPFATGMTDDEAGGFTVDLWKAVAAEEGLKYTIRVRPFHHLLQEFREGKIDVLINLAQSPERHRFADFTVPHVVVNGAIFVRKGEWRISSEEDLAGKSIIVLNADLAHDYAISKGWGKQLVLVDTAAEGLSLLASGKYDAMLLSKLTGMQTLQKLQMEGVEALKIKVGFAQKFSFAVHEGESVLLGRINEGLALTKSNGTYNTLYDKWFGIYADKEVGLRDLLKIVIPIALVLLGIAVYSFYRRQVERNKNELALKESEARFRLMADSAPVMIWLAEPDKRCSWFNKVWLEFTGRSLEQELNSGWSEGVHPEDIQRCLETYDASFSARDAFSMEYRLRRFDGEYRWIIDSGVPRLDESGNFAGYIGSCFDITDRKKAEMELLQSVSVLNATLESVSDAILVVDLNNTWVLYNRQFLYLWNITDEIIEARDDNAALSYVLDQLENPDGFLDKVHRLYATPEANSFDTLLFKNGKVIERYSLPQFIDGKVAGRVWSFRDVTERKQALDQLSTLSTAIEQSPISVVITDVDGNIEYVNPNFETITGYSASEAIGRNPRILKSGLTAMETYRDLWHKVTNGQVWHGELINRRKNGETYWEEVHIAPVKNEGGELAHYVAAKVDITQRKQHEEALRESEQRYHFLFDNNPMPMWVYEQSSLRFLVVNDRALEHYGYTREEFGRMSLRDIRPAEDIAELERVTSAASTKPISGEWRHTKKDGTVINVVVHTVPMTYNGIPAKIVLIQDITERKRAENDLRDSEERFRQLFEKAPIGIAIAKQGHKIKTVNDAYCRMFGYTQEELSQMTFAALTHPDYVGLNQRLADVVLTGETPAYAIETKYLRKDHEVFWGQLVATEISGQHPDERYIMEMVEDITERVEREKLRLNEVREQRDVLVREVHHRIKNNLQGVVGLLRQHATDHPELAGMIEMIVGRIYSIAIIHGLQAETLSEDVDLDVLIRNIVDASGSQVAYEGVLLDPVALNREEAVPIALVLNELITNACKHRLVNSVVSIRLKASREVTTITLVNQFDDKRDAESSGGHGLNLVKSLLPRKSAGIDVRREGGVYTVQLSLSHPVTISKKNAVQ